MLQLILFLVSVFALVFIIPILIIKLKASRNGAQITYKEVLFIYNRNTARTPILKALAISQAHNLNIELTNLESHFFAGGNLELLMNAIVKFKNNKAVNYQMLAALDLADMNLEEIIEKGISEHQIEFDHFSIRNFKVSFYARFFFRLGVAFRDTQVEDVRAQIMQKLVQFGLNWDTKDQLKTKLFIESNVLNEEYWESVLCVNLVEQRIELKK